MTETKGERGAQGRQGMTGKAGRVGDTGRQGMTGKAGSDPTRRLAILFAFLAVISTTYGIVLQQAVNQINTNTVRIEAERVAVLNESCRNSLDILVRYNILLDALIAVDEEIMTVAPNLPAAALEARITAYEEGKIDPPVCKEIKP